MPGRLLPGVGPHVIVTVTPNPALDVTYAVERLTVHRSHRVLEVREVAGGKGLNVASVLSSQGQPVLAVGLVGGAAGERLLADLDARGIRHSCVTSPVETRRTVTVVSRADGEATAFNEPGAPCAPGQWDSVVAHTGRVLVEHGAAVLVASGSVPPGFPSDGYAQLVAAGHAAGCRVVLDASGDALLGGVAAGPDVVKPNRDELAEVTGSDDPVAGARLLQDRGAGDVLVSLGPDGMVWVPAQGPVLRAALGHALRGNPTGAGDAAVAAVAAGLLAGEPPELVLRNAVAWSAAAVLQPVAGVVSADDLARLGSDVTIWRD